MIPLGSEVPPPASFILRGAIHGDLCEAFTGKDLLHGAHGDLAAVAVSAEVREHDVSQGRVADVF